MIILWVWESAKQVSLKEASVHQGALGIAEIKTSDGAAVRGAVRKNGIQEKLQGV